MAKSKYVGFFGGGGGGRGGVVYLFMFLIKDNILEFVKIYHVLGYASLISHLDHLQDSGQQRSKVQCMCIRWHGNSFTIVWGM